MFHSNSEILKKKKAFLNKCILEVSLSSDSTQRRNPTLHFIVELGVMIQKYRELCF